MSTLRDWSVPHLVGLLRVLGRRHELLRKLDAHVLGVGAEGGKLLCGELGPDDVLLVDLEGEPLLTEQLGLLDKGDPVLLEDGGLQQLPVAVIDRPPAPGAPTLGYALVLTQLGTKYDGDENINQIKKNC